MADDRILAAFMAALCDLLAVSVYEGRAVLQLLETKGYLSHAEWLQAKREISPQTYAKLAADLHRQLQSRTAEYLAGRTPPPMIQ